MFTYRELPAIQGQPAEVVLRLPDLLNIPFDPDNTDYQKYLEWVAEGNTPDPAE